MNARFVGGLLPSDSVIRELIDGRGFDTTDVRLIGWGTGSVFDYFHHRHPLPLAYLVDNASSRWGDRRAGLTVLGPDRLRVEDPARTLVIVYSGAWPEIVQQLASMGFPRAVAASIFFTVTEDPSLRALLASAARLMQEPVVRCPQTDRAIVAQGPITPGLSAYALRLTAVTHPHDRIVLSTWDDTPAELLTEVTPFVDDVVLSPVPQMVGIQNRNCQIVSARAGIERARERGALTVLKSRTDLAILNPHVFDEAAALEARFPATAARAFGRDGRLIVPSSFTRKYLLYHPSDLAMLGAADDLLAYWSAALDPRSGRLEDGGRDGLPLRDLNLDGNPTEAYLALQYCRRIGREVTGHVLDSWAVYRDLFAVVDHDWFELLWLKNLAITDLNLRHGPRQLVDHAFWRRLVEHGATSETIVPEIDPGRLTLRDFGAAA